MSDEKTNINFGFANILRKIDGTSIGRKELIQLTMEVNQFDKTDAQRYVGRHIHQLKKKSLIRTEGGRNSTRYVFSESLSELLAGLTATPEPNDDKSETAVVCSSSLQYEKERLSAELKLAMGEVEAFQDYLGKFPEAKKVILDLLRQSRDTAAMLYGKLNAIQKIIDATSSDSASVC